MKKILIISIIAIIIVTFLSVMSAGFYQHVTQTTGDDNHYSTPVVNPQTFSGTNINVFSATIGNITIDTILPESPRDIRIYRGYFKEGDLVENYSGLQFDEIQNPVPKDQAPAVAEQILTQYGGLPSDAQLLYSLVNYGEVLNRTTHEIIERIPTGTFVSWYRNIDGMRIEGDSDIIQVTLGENGTPTRVYKAWRTYEPLGNVSLIPVSKAIDKLASGEVINPFSAEISDVSIYKIQLGYYIKGLEEPEVTTEPIWVFYGNASGNYVPFYVYARQFSNFTATPVTGTVPLATRFNDTSNASPTRWLWDFGDGTNSTVRNATHVYNISGTYNVTLRAWNDLGSDTITKVNFIRVSPQIFGANFTVSPATGIATLPVRFTDTSNVSATRWLWDFGDGTNSTVQNPTHTYESPGTYDVTLQVSNNYGNDTIVRQYTVEPSLKIIANATVYANYSYYATIDETVWYNDYIFGVVGNSHFNTTAPAWNWTKTWITYGTYGYYLEQLKVGETYYPATPGPSDWQWVVVDRLDEDAIQGWDSQFWRCLGGYVSPYNSTYYLWYGNVTAAEEHRYGTTDWLYPSYENATYLVKIDVIWDDE
ncbi:MAG: PKD domain-containing protein [Methanoregula sp.]|nr:PKD domain-containing protein [Methanoregula sp.]